MSLYRAESVVRLDMDGGNQSPEKEETYLSGRAQGWVRVSKKRLEATRSDVAKQ